MTEIQLNCLAVPRNLVGKITQHHVVTLNINSEETVHSLRREIKKEYMPRFDDISITEFIVRLTPFSSNVTVLLTSINKGDVEGRVLYPMSVISEHFCEQPSKKDIHILVYLDIPTPTPDS